MSLYREVGRTGRATWIAVAAGLVLGLLGGVILGRATKPDPTFAEQVAEVRERVEPTLQGLELVELHYASAGRAAAADQAERAEESFADAADDLSALDPEATEQARRELARVAQLTEAGAPADRVEAAVARAERAVRRAAPHGG